MKETLKIVLIGAASPQWGYTISRDLIVSLSQEKICGSYDPILVLEDVNPTQLDLQARLAGAVSRKAGARVRVEHTTDQAAALDGARFAVVTFAVGSLEAMQHDLEIPAEYGVYQPVGDSISVGGAIRGVRNIPALVGIARDMEKHAHSDAWILNLANPMSILCRAVTRETRIRTIGCCHELYGTVSLLSKLLGFPYEEWRERLRLRILGINHCGWIQSMKIDGTDGLRRFREYLASRGITGERRRLYDSDAADLARHNVKINLFLRHGCLPYSGDRHTVEFFAEFVNRRANQGADFGVLLTTAQERLVAWRGRARADVQAMLRGEKEMNLALSQEAAAKIMPALLLGDTFYDVGNLPYHGDGLPGVPQGAVLERMVTYGRNGARPDPVKPLPQPLQKHLALIAGLIEDIVEASVNGNRQRLVQALRRDPLLENMSRGKIPEMVGRLLDVHRGYAHPGFF
jgi:alpha-galactosidase